MKKIILCIVGFVFAIVLGIAIWFVFFWQPGPDYDMVAYLEQPEITDLPDELMMTLTLTGATGTPSELAAEGMRILYRTYRQAGGKWSDQIAARARWSGDVLDLTTSTITATFALPMPVGVTTIPENSDKRILVKTWEYGTVAQMLHVGSYLNEQPTVDRLHQYIIDQGYVIIGEHEEIYLKGPNLFGFGNEDNYLTIIRYQVEPVTE